MTVTKSQSSKRSQEKSRESGRKWDGRSRPSNDLYKKNYDEIFRKDKAKEKDKEANKQR